MGAHILQSVEPATSPKLTLQQVSAIAQSLESHAKERGTTILGAQLGALINAAIRPKLLRELGGMSYVARTSLASYIQPVSRNNVSDVLFEITMGAVATPRRVPDTPLETTGNELWRFFSNPRIPGFLTATPAGIVYACTTVPEGTSATAVLAQPTSEDYRHLAVQFAEQVQEPVRALLQATLGTDDFYNDWIVALRTHRTDGVNLLKRWEVLRTEFVAGKLSSALVDAGVDVVRAAEIVAAARPAVSRRQQPGVEVTQNIEFKHPAPLSMVSPPAESVASQADEISALRRALHSAIDSMALTDLQALPIPTGIMLAAALSSRK